MEFRAHMVYPDSQAGVPARALDSRFIENLGGFIRRLAA